MKQIPIIDLFAGPGGLGEGFSSVQTKEGKNAFKIKLSIEKDKFAHKTLELRAFYRGFLGKEAPLEYYEYLRGRLNREELFNIYQEESSITSKEAWLAELGVTPNELVDSHIKKALEGATDWVLIGGPPCQAYSLIGRSRIRGENEDKYEKDNRHFLYKEYLRILSVHKPSVFVMENVKGLLSAEVKKSKIFNQILSDLRYPDGALTGNKLKTPLVYKLFSVSHHNSNDLTDPEPEDFIVRSEEYGIPQARHRVIILGIRSDKHNSNPRLLENKNQVFIEEVIGDLPKIRSGLSKTIDSSMAWRDEIRSIGAASWLKSIPPSLRREIVAKVKRVSSRLTRGSMFATTVTNPNKYRGWYLDSVLGGICNHESRSHIREDLHRYFFAAVFAIENGRSPNLNDFPRELLPLHNNIREALNGSKFNDRFRVQIPGRPSTTLVSHISKDGHYYIHYDPQQCRSLTVREAARLQTFPDNYFFEGPRTEQYQQVGNAVPPLLAKQIAEIVSEVIQNFR